MKMKEFDLRKALTGHPVKTRNGHKAAITSFTGSVRYPLAGVIYSHGELGHHTWTIDGHWSEFNDEYDLDLVMA